jgi:hypothetical protein
VVIINCNILITSSRFEVILELRLSRIYPMFALKPEAAAIPLFSYLLRS